MLPSSEPPRPWLTPREPDRVLERLGPALGLAPERFNSPSALYQPDLEKDERQVAEWYDTLSGSYDELYGREQSSKHKMVLEFLENRHFRVLVDIGCGTGSFLEKAHRAYDRSVGIDLSAKMLRIAKNRRIPNTDLVLASSSWLPFKDESSDCTVSISTMKAQQNLPSLIADIERIGRGDNLLAITLFQHPGAESPMPLPRRVQATKVSERETLYFLHLSDTPDDSEVSTERSWTLRTRPDSLGLTRMPGCSHQWRGRGQMARCIRCGKLKTDFRKEQHNQKMLAREDTES